MEDTPITEAFLTEAGFYKLPIPHETRFWSHKPTGLVIVEIEPNIYAFNGSRIIKGIQDLSDSMGFLFRATHDKEAIQDFEVIVRNYIKMKQIQSHE